MSTTNETVVKKISFGAINKKKESGSKTDYPVYPDETGLAEELATRISERTDQFDALKSALETDKVELARTLIKPWYFTHFHGKVEVPTSVLVRGKDCTVRVTIVDGYYQLPEDKWPAAVLSRVLGDHVDTYFRQAFEMKIDGDKIPGDQAQDLINELEAVFAKYNASEALTVDQFTKPVPNFKSLRFTQMTLEQSLALEKIGDKGLTKTMVATKGRK